MVDSYSEFTITSIFSFFYHEALYFGFAFFWFVIDRIPAFKKYKIQANKPTSSEEQWKCFKGLMFSHIVIQFPMMLLTHHVLKILGYVFKEKKRKKERKFSLSLCFIFFLFSL